MNNQQNGANSFGDAQIREAYDHTPAQKPPDYCINLMKAYASTKRTRDDSSVVRCATFEEFDGACELIEIVSTIPFTKVYPALREVGYNMRYTDMKNSNPDALWDLGDVVYRCKLLRDDGLKPFLKMSRGLFTNTVDASYRMSTPTIGETGTWARKAGIKISELNLYNALSGLELLTQTDPDYYMLIDDKDVKESMHKLGNIRDLLMAKRNVLVKMLGD